MWMRHMARWSKRVACAVLFGVCANVLYAADTLSLGVLYSNENENKYVHPEGTIVATRFYIGDAGKNFYRKPVSGGSFESFLLNLPVKPVGYMTHFYDGEEKSFDVQIGVLDVSVGEGDFMKSAGVLVKLRAEYLFASKLYGRIHFNLVNGFVCSYSRWAAGFRLNDSYNSWVLAGEQDYGQQTFEEYLNSTYKYVTTSSIAKEMTKVELKDVKGGDVLIQSSHPGHAVIILDALFNEVDGVVKLMLAQGFSPTQEIEILKNYEDGESPWFSVPLDATDDTMIRTPQWTFYVKDLKRFTN